MKPSTRRGGTRRARRASAREYHIYQEQLRQALRRASDKAVELGVPIEQIVPSEPMLMKASCAEVYRAAMAELRSLKQTRRGTLNGQYSARRVARQ